METMVGGPRLIALTVLLSAPLGCGGVSRSASAHAGAGGADAHTGGANAGGANTIGSAAANAGGANAGGANAGGANAGGANTRGSAAANGETPPNGPPPLCFDGYCPPPNAIAIGDAHACVLVGDGTVKCWGANDYGQLGDGSEVSREGPVQVKGVSNAKSVSSGSYHSCALLKDGTVSCWGIAGTRGIDSPSSGTPKLVPNIDRVTIIAAGGGYTCALLAGGTVWCWGAVLGTPGDEVAYAPVRIEGITGARNLAAGMLHACAALADGSAKCWGWNGVGTLGDGTTTDRAQPVTVVGLHDVRALALGWWVSCALKTDNTASCWGDNSAGALGTALSGPGQEQSVPPVAAMGLSNVVMLAAGGDHVCAGLDDGTVSCWGNNKYGQVGDGSGTHSVSSPSRAQGLSHVKGLALSMVRSYALVDDGGAQSAWCWPCDGDLASNSSTTPMKSENDF